MRKVAFLIHQYGSEIVGGAESYTKSLAEHMVGQYDVTVLTTTSNDYLTWNDYYPIGEQIIDHVNVIRFSAEKKRDINQFSNTCNTLNGKISAGQCTTVQEDEQWITEEGPYCPDMVEYVRTYKNVYDVFIVVTYIYYIAVKCIPEVASRTLFIPTAHDEPWIRLGMFKNLFCMPAYYGFLTEEERDLVRERFHNRYIPGDILGIGIDTPAYTDNAAFRKKFDIKDEYIIYVGRLDASKGCDTLIKYFLQYKHRIKSALKLVLVGKGSMPIPASEDIISTGFVSDQEKYDAIAGAVAMVTPSPYESLCIALLESLALEVPVIANAKCEVLKGQCIRSNAGLFYENVEEFIQILEYFRSNPQDYQIMKQNGKLYIEKRYRWSVVQEKVSAIIEYIALKNSDIEDSKELSCKDYMIKIDRNKSIPKTFNTNAVAIVFVSDDGFFDFLGVAINSIILNSTYDNNYDIMVLTIDMSEEHMEDILSLKGNRSNITIRFVNVESFVNHVKFNVSDNYNSFTYYRLLLQNLMKDYEKVLYLDADVIVNTDLAPLYNTRMDNCLIAGTYDMLIAAWQNYDSGMQAYFEALGINDPGKYVQAGVLLFNITEMNKTFHRNFLLEKACTERYILNDQDLLNVYCKGKICYFDVSWDVLNLSAEGKDVCVSHLPGELKEQYQRARNKPKIVHYTEQSFPCWKPERDFSELYWEYAEGTRFFSYLVERKEKHLHEAEKRQPIDKKGGVYKTKNKIQNLLMKCKAGEAIVSLLGGNSCNFDGMKFGPDVNFTKKSAILPPGAEMKGPNFFLGKGKHFVDFIISSKIDNETLELRIVAGAGHILIKQDWLCMGKNHISYEVDKNHVDVEFLMVNTTNMDIIINEFQYC